MVGRFGPDTRETPRNLGLAEMGLGMVVELGDEGFPIAARRRRAGGRPIVLYVEDSAGGDPARSPTAPLQDTDDKADRLHVGAEHGGDPIVVRDFSSNAQQLAAHAIEDDEPGLGLDQLPMRCFDLAGQAFGRGFRPLYGGSGRVDL
jgi:hypothetical protein